MVQKKQNTEGTIRKRVFLNGANFVKVTKFYKNNIFKRKRKKTQLDLSKVFVKEF